MGFDDVRSAGGNAGGVLLLVSVIAIALILPGCSPAGFAEGFAGRFAWTLESHHDPVSNRTSYYATSWSRGGSLLQAPSYTSFAFAILNCGTIRLSANNFDRVERVEVRFDHSDVVFKGTNSVSINQEFLERVPENAKIYARIVNWTGVSALAVFSTSGLKASHAQLCRIGEGQ